MNFRYGFFFLIFIFLKFSKKFNKKKLGFFDKFFYLQKRNISIQFYNLFI